VNNLLPTNLEEPCWEFAGSAECFLWIARTGGLEDESVAVDARPRWWKMKVLRKRRTVAAQDDTDCSKQVKK
jgi:hypothetical protein